MNIKTILSILCLTFILALVCALPVFAASVTVSPSGGGAFVLQGSGIDGAAAIDLTVAYDTAALSNPRVEQGALISGALMAVNDKVPGSIRMAIVRVTPIQGSGIIATLRFDLKGGSAGKIAVTSVRLSNIDGRPLSADSGAAASGDQQTREEQQQDAPGSGASPSSASGLPAPLIAPIGIPVAPRTPDETANITTAPSPTAEPQERTAASEPVQTARKDDRELSPLDKTPAKNIHKHKSVLDRFQGYKGDRTPAASIALFDPDGAIGFRQEPQVVIADGKRTVQVTFISDPVKKETSPDVAVFGAKLVSLKKDPDFSNTWVAELKPEKDAFQSSLTVSLEKMTIVYPLVVAPARDIDLDRSGKVTEADFALFLKKRGTQKVPEFDLNGDGKRDYLDEYLFTANYLASRQGAQTTAGSK